MLALIRKYPVVTVLIICMGVLIGFLVIPSPAARLREKEVKSMTSGRKVILACRQYSREHGGVYPPSLDTLFPTYLQDRSSLVSPLNPGEPVGYTYTPPPPARTDSPDTVVLEDKFAPSLANNRIVVYANGSARILGNVP